MLPIDQPLHLKVAQERFRSWSVVFWHVCSMQNMRHAKNAQIACIYICAFPTTWQPAKKENVCFSEHFGNAYCICVAIMAC